MLRKLKRQKIKKSKQPINLYNSNQRLIASTLLIAYTSFIFQPIAYAQQIITDGRTNTTVDVNGTVSNVSTSTIHGANAFNSFSRFNVNEGNTVNLIVPNSAANLINLINGETSRIDGILNSLKNGQIGGNVYLLNPDGVIFGKNSNVNVGSLNVYTPTKDQMNKYLDLNGNINNVEIGKLTNGEVALTDSGLITVDGKINALKDVTFGAGNVNINGDILSGAAFQNNKVDFSDVVNVNGYNANNMSMVAENGEIVIKAVNNVEISGKVVNDGSNNRNAGNIDIDAGTNIVINENAVISAKGMDENSNGGNINILAQNDTTFKKNALIDVKGGMLSGDAGFIELSAKKNVNLNGGVFEAFAQNGKNGTILIDPENLYITTNNLSNGANISLEADKLIDVADNIIISSRKLNNVNTENHLTALSTGNSGSITLNAPEIKVKSGAKLLSFADSGYTSGDINLTASANRNSPVYANINSLIDIGQNVVFNGNNISLKATADSTNYFDENTSSFVDTALDYLDNFSLFAGYSEVKAESKINIGSSTTITSKNDFTAESKTTAEAKITTTTTGVGVSVAKVDSDANITIGENVSINSGKDIKINASNDSKLNSSVTAYYFGDSAGLSTNITFAYGDMKADTKVDISNTSSLTAGSNININANTNKNMSVSATSNSLEDGNSGISVAVSTSEVNNTVETGGTLKAKNIDIKSNVTVVDKYDNYDSNPDKNFEAGNSTKASTDVGSGIGGKIMVPIAKNTGLKGKMSSWFGNKDQSTTNSQSGGTKLALAGGVAYANHTNNSKLIIKDGAKLEAKDTTSGSGNIILNSEIKEMVEVSAKSFVNPQDEQKKANAVSAAVAISTFNNNSETKIGNGSILNASHNIEVKSKYKMPYHITWHEINGVSDIFEKLNGDLGIQNGIFTTWARSTAGTSDGSGGSGDGIGIAGSFNVADFNSTSKAIIGNNVKINQDASFKTNTQKLIVDAISEAQTVNFSGIVGLKFFGADGGKGGAGGSYIDIGYNNDVQAIINSDSTINANYLQVNADSAVNNLSIAASAAKAGKYAFSGSFGFLNIDNTTLAQIDSDSIINIDSISGFSVADEIENGLEVTATDDSKAINITGGVAKAKNAGIGASLSVSEIKRDTQAIIGKNVDNASVKDNLILTTDSSILTKAKNTGLISTWGLAGAIVSNEPSGVGSKDAANKGGASGSGQYGLAVSGDVGISTINETIKAYLNDVTLDTKAHNLSVNAVSDNDIDAVSGSAALSLGGTQGKSVGIAGSYSSNEINSDIEAFILDTDIDNSTQGGNITLDSEFTGDIWTISAGASGATGIGGIAVAGSVSINDLNIKNSSYIKDSTINDITNVSLSTTNNAGIQAYGGVLSAGSTAGVGAALALNSMGEDEANKNSAYISNSTITNTGNIKLDADSNNTIKTITGTVGVGKTAGVAVSVSLNEINNNTSAYVENSSSLTPGGKLEIDTDDTSVIKAVVASAAVAGSVSAGVSIVTNDINNEIKSYIDSSNVNATGDISLSATSDNTIEALSLAFSTSGSVGLSGSDASNEIDNKTKSYITNSNGTNKIKSGSGNITLFAEDTSGIKSIAGSAAIGGFGFGVSLADNTIQNEIETYISNSIVDANKKVDLNAESTQEIEVWAVAGAAAAAFSGAASVSLNDLDNKVKAYINNSSNITGSGGINVTALSKAENIVAKTGGIGISLGAAFGGAMSTIDINNTTEAFIDNSTVNSSSLNDIVVDASSIESTDNKVLAGAASLYASANAAYSESNSTSKTKAYLGNDVTVNQTKNIIIKADRQVDLYSEALGGSIGQVAVGASIAKTTINGDAEAYIGNNVKIGQDTSKTVGGVDIDASATLTGNSKTKAGSAGIYSGNGSDARTILTPTIRAYIGNNALIDTDNSININTTTKIKSIADALGGSFGGIAVGVSIAEAKASPIIETYIGDDADIEAKEINLGISHNSGISDMAKAYADTSAGALIGGNGTLTLAQINSTINSYIGEDSQITTTDNISLTVNSYNAAQSNASGRAYGLVAGGYTEAKTDIDENNNIYIKSNTIAGKSINATNVNLTLKADKYADTNVTAGSGGMVGGSGSVSDLDVTSNNKVYTGNSISSAKNNINVSKKVVLDADSTLSYKTTNNNSAAGIIAAGIPRTYNDITLTTDVAIGNYNNITTGEDLTLDGYNRISNFGSGYSLIGGASGLGTFGSGDSTSNIDSTINAAIGSYSDLNIGGNLNMLLNADSIISESANLVAQGAISYANINTSIDIDNALTATFDTNSTVDAYNNINTYLKSNTSATSYVLSECKGLAPIANGRAKADVSSTNFINIKGNSLIRPNKDAYFVIGKDIRGNNAYNKAIANARGDSAGLLWNFGSVSADADVGINNDISIAGGANITAGEDVNLLSNSGSTYSSGYSVSKSKFYLLFGIPITRYKHGGSSDTSTSNDVEINGAVKSGLYNNRKLTIALDGTITEDGVNLDGTAEYAYNQEQELQVEIDAITADITELNTDLTEAKANKTSAQTTLTTKNTEKETLETSQSNKEGLVTTKNGQIATNNSTITTKNASILTLQGQINALDKTASDYETKKIALESQISTLESEISTLEGEIATLDGAISTLNGEISDIKADIITKENQIDEAEADLSNKSQIVSNIDTDIKSLEQDKLNLIDAKADATGGTTISALKVKPATIDSGYVNINGTLSGTGSITAPGNDFSIEVINRTTKNMVFDVLKINQNANGDINLNGSKLISNYGNSKGTIAINPGTNKGKKIDIYNAFDPDDPSVDLSLLTYKDSSDILFSKDIENLGGDFTVRNMSGSVITQGLINAQNVFIYVPKGDYIHEFTKGRYLTGGTAGTSILYAGENIIISAQKIDVNGTIQSGTDYRSVVINNFNPLTDLTYNDVTEKTELIPVTTLGSNKDINGIKAVWDSGAQRIKLYRADIRGGNIVLQGEILSSGNGKLKVVSGYGEINVINNTNYDLEVNQLNTNQEINGKVYINNFKISNTDADSIVNKTTTFQKYIKDKGLQSNEISISRDDSKVIHVQNSVGTDITSPNVTISGQNNATYSPNSDAAYQQPATGSYGYWKYIPRSGWTEFWHGKRYDWTIVTYSYTATIAAKQPIGIEFLGKDQGLINITNNGTSNIYLKENIMNNSGDINIANPNGSIFNLGNSTIQSKNISLTAKNNIGSTDTAISTDLRDGYLNAVSTNSGLINIEEKIGQMLVNKAITAGDLTLTADGAIRQTGYVGSGIVGHNVSLNSTNADVGTISQDILVSTTGSLSIDAQSSVFITENGDIKANTIKSEDGDVKLTATSIDSARNDGKANITAKNITLNSTNNVGSLASDDQALFIDNTGDLNIQSGTDIHLNALSGININKVYSNTGNVKLLSQGNINANVLVNLSDLDAENKTNVNIANIKGNNLDIISTEGGISNVNVDLDGIVNAQAKKSVILSNTNHVVPDSAKNDITQARTYVDDLRIGTVYSESGAVVLTSERSILDAKAGEDLNISGTNVALTANLGSIGTAADDLNIKSTGVLTASSYDNIYITSPNNINISSMDSSAKEENKYVMLENVVLKSAGNILDGSDFEYYNIESKNITLNASKIGDENNYLDVNSDVVNVTAPSGIYIKETAGNLNITANSVSGNIMTTANDGAINASVVAGGFLRALAKDNINITETADDMLLDTIESTSGDIDLTSSLGSIIDYNSGTNNITGANVTLTAVNSINNDITASKNLNMTATSGSINAEISATGTVTSVSNNDTSIEALSGDINVKTINSQIGDITLKADNSILDALDISLDNTTNVTGKKLTLTAVNGSIGSLTRDLIATSSDTINMTAQNNITVASDSTNNTDMEAKTGNINVKTIVSQLGDVTLKAGNSILDLNSDDSANITGKDLILTAVNDSIGSSLSDLRTISSNKINMAAKKDIYLTEDAGDLISDSIKANTGSIKLTTVNGNIKINNISAAEDINIKANGDLIDIETIDPKKIDLAVSNTGGSIDVNKGFVSEYVKMTADNIKGNFEDTNFNNPLTFYITANKNANAKNINLDVNAGNFGIEKLASNYARINSKYDVLNWQQVKIGDRLDLITPSRTILLKNILGHLDLTKDVELYETGWFNFISDSFGVKTSAFVKYVAPGQRVNWDSQPVKTSNSAVSSNNSNMSKSQEDTHEILNPPDLRDQLQNKRDSIRYTINTDGIIKIADRNINIKVIDISSGGAGISVNKDISIGEQLDFKLNFDELEINTKSTVVSKQYDEETGTYKLGLKFTDLTPDIAEKIPYTCMSLSLL